MIHKITLFLSLVLFSFGYAAPVIYDNLQIEKIDIQVATDKTEASTTAQVYAKMSTRDGNFFSQAEFDQDLKNLSLEYDRVDPYLTINEGKLKITLKVWPKPMIRSLTYEGNNKLATKKLQGELGIAPCTVFDRRIFNEAFHKVKTYYVKKGFFEAELDYEINYDECTNEVDIRLIICEGRSGRIKSIKFSGFSSCEEIDLAKKMVTKEYNFLLSWLTEEGTYREDAMQHDQFQILNYLQNKGYADAQVHIEVTEADCDDRIAILISAEKGEIYTVDEITFEGNCLFDDDKIRSRFPFQSGDPFSPEKLRETVTSITDLYGKYGYIDAFVNYEPNLECDRSYSVHFQIDEGEQFRVGLIKVIGNCTTMTSTILHETLLVPGEVFNTEKMKLTEDRLLNIGYFKKVNVYAVKTEECALEGNYRDVHIEVEETGTGKFGFFGGFSTTENLFGGINLSESNFNIQGLPYAWSRGLRALRGGGEYISLSAQVGMKSRSYNLSWTKPYFMDTKWSVGFDLEKGYNNYLSESLDIESAAFTLRAGRQLNSFVRFQWHWRLSTSDVEFDQDTPPFPNPNDPTKMITRKITKEELKVADPHLYEVQENDGLVSATGVSLTYDSTDSLNCPTKGIKSVLEAEVAGLGGRYNFWSFGYLNTYYYSFTDNLILKFRGDIRFITPFLSTTYDSMPLNERLFLGNNTFVRGYRPFAIGPTFEKTIEIVDEEGTEYETKDTHIPRGGLSQQFLSLELNRKLSDRFDGFLFMDMGYISARQWRFSWGGLKKSVGFGIRVSILDSLPPISLGIGYPINPSSKSEVKQFFIQFGCKF